MKTQTILSLANVCVYVREYKSALYIFNFAIVLAHYELAIAEFRWLFEFGHFSHLFNSCY